MGGGGSGDDLFCAHRARRVLISIDRTTAYVVGAHTYARFPLRLFEYYGFRYRSGKPVSRPDRNSPNFGLFGYSRAYIHVYAYTRAPRVYARAEARGSVVLANGKARKKLQRERARAR